MSDPYKTPESETFDPNSELEGAMINYQFWKQFIKYLKLILCLIATFTIISPLISSPSRDLAPITKNAFFIFVPFLFVLAFSYYKLISTKVSIHKLKNLLIKEED